MKAITYTSYGSPDVIRISEVERPEPKDNEVLIRIRAASVNALDRHYMRGEPYVMRIGAGLRGPRVTRLGVDVAGEVMAVGSKVTEFQPGNEVFGVCRGAFAEYSCAPESRLVLKSSKISFEQAAAIPVAGCTALQALRDKGRIEPGQRVLINGAGGGVGTFAVQIARAMGAEVTAATTTRNLEVARAMGADHLIDYTREDFTKSGEQYDAILDLGANHSLSSIRKALTPNGKWLLVGGVGKGHWVGPVATILAALAQGPFVSQKVVIVPARVTQGDLIAMQRLVEDGKVVPAIDRTYPLSDAGSAMRYFETGQVQGKVVITNR